MSELSPSFVPRSFAREWVDELIAALAQWAPADELCGAVGLVDDGSGRVPRALVVRLLDLAADISGDDLLGLHLGERRRPRDVLTYLVRAQATLREAITTMARFQHLLPAVPSVVVVERGDAVQVILFWPDADAGSRHLVEMCLAVVGLEGQRNVTPRVDLREVAFRHPPGGSRREYERVFGCPVRFGREADALVVPRAALDRSMREGNPTVAATIARPARSQLERSGALTFADCVALTMRSALLSAGPSEAEAVAEQLAVSRRTLHRRLWETRTTFGALREGVQRAVVMNLLALPSLTAADIQRRSGFASLEALDAAVRGWTGRALDWR